jgi:uncharacterized membrane protein
MSNSERMDNSFELDPLDRQADRVTIQALFTAGHLSTEAVNVATDLLKPPPVMWWRWANRMLLMLGPALILAGVIFFFAYNWAKIGPFVKFGLVESGIVACIVSRWKIGHNSAVGKLLLLSAALLVGVFLSIYGQVYQTGADPFELFAGWSLLILGWVTISRFGALWLMWLILLNATIILYWAQVAIPNAMTRTETMFVLLAATNSIALVWREYGLQKGISWLAGRWIRWVLLISILTYLVIPTIEFIVDDDMRSGRPVAIIAILLFVLLLVAIYGFYRYRSQDLFALTLGMLSVCIVSLTLIGRVLFEISDEAGMFLFFGLVILGLISGATFWLRRTAVAMERERHN